MVLPWDNGPSHSRLVMARAVNLPSQASSNFLRMWTCELEPSFAVRNRHWTESSLNFDQANLELHLMLLGQKSVPYQTFRARAFDTFSELYKNEPLASSSLHCVLRRKEPFVFKTPASSNLYGVLTTKCKWWNFLRFIAHRILPIGYVVLMNTERSQASFFLQAGLRKQIPAHIGCKCLKSTVRFAWVLFWNDLIYKVQLQSYFVLQKYAVSFWFDIYFHNADTVHNCQFGWLNMHSVLRSFYFKTSFAGSTGFYYYQVFLLWTRFPSLYHKNAEW